jgi:uncharacterized protein YjlB
LAAIPTRNNARPRTGILSADEILLLEYDFTAYRKSARMEQVEAIQKVNIIRHLLQDDGVFPNNALLPLLVYQKAVNVPDRNAASIIIEFLETNGWINAWEGGVYDFDHYHSTAHEVLVVIKGSARIQFGGPAGVALLVESGDAVVIPAGVAHKAIDLYDEFTCIGAYPTGQDYDLRKGSAEEREQSLQNIKAVPLPTADPIYGTEGPLVNNWKL